MNSKVVSRFTIAAVLLGMILLSPASVMPALAAGSPDHSLNLTSLSIDQYTVKYPTQTTITSDQPDPSQSGEPFTVSFRVTSSHGTPYGSVTVTASPGGATCTGVLLFGSGSCSLVLNNPGSYILTARYSGNATYYGSSDTEPHRVVQAWTTTVILSDSPDPSLSGQPFKVSCKVASIWSTPTGSVTVMALGGAASCTGEVLDGRGSCILTVAEPGDYTLIAYYPGDSSHTPSHDSEPHAVRAATTTVLSDIPDPSLPGQSFTVTFSVTSDWGMPIGSIAVTTSQGGASCTGQLVDGSGYCSLALAQPGEYTLEAAYSGDENHLGSGFSETHTVSSMRIYLPVMER